MAQEPAERRPARVVVAVVVTLTASVSFALVSWIPGYRSFFRGLPEIAWWIENAVRPLIPVGLGLLFVHGAHPARWARERSRAG